MDSPMGTRYEAAVSVADGPGSVLLPGHDVPLGRYTTVRRLLPQRELRTVGAWCFADLFGPADVANRPGMQVPPHPHTGLQTVTWLVEGEILHRDSLGNVQTIVPGQLNLMTSGRGIAHAETSPARRPPVMHGLQLWVALPDAARHGDPRFEHHAALPHARLSDVDVTVVVGVFDTVVSPAWVPAPLLGAQLDLAGEARLPLRESFEHAVLVLSGAATVAGTVLEPGSLLYLGTGRRELAISGQAVLFLLGGEPFEEPLVMWWNFVGRDHEEIAQSREDWMAGRRFGTVAGYPGEALPAPPMPLTRLKPRPRAGRPTTP